jgi:coatomer subunit beta'
VFKNFAEHKAFKTSF